MTTATTPAAPPTTTTAKPPRIRRRLQVLADDYFPAYVVWELTLRCDHACAHCGSRAGGPREHEVSTEHALEIVQQLKAMRTFEVVLIGGEAYLHEGFLEIIRALKAAGIRATMTTGGKGITAELAQQMKAAGLHSVSVSVDGLEAEHNLMRQSKHSFSGAMAAIDRLRAAGLLVAANTNINRLNAPVLEPLFALLADKGIAAWQVQLTVPLGRAADRPQLLLQPFELVELVPRLAQLKVQALARNIVMMPGNNLGYFGPEEALLRSPHDVREPGAERDHWQGCQAGKRVMGIESDGAVKGCPSLQPHYIGGHLGERSLKDLWDNTQQLQFARVRTVDDLWGYCRTCTFAEVCMAGCTFTVHALFGRPGNNPYCHFRARALKAEGKRERLVPGQAAEGRPFDHGLFDLVVEPFDAPEPTAHVHATTNTNTNTNTPTTAAALVQISRRATAAP